MARRLLRSRTWLLFLALLGACALPVNTAVRDWARRAGIAVTRPDVATPEATEAARSMQQALSTYFRTLAVLWDGAVPDFDEAPFVALAQRVPDPVPSRAILDLAGVLRAASDEKPPRWLPLDNSGPTPAYEDRRLSTAIRAADPPVQLLLVALSGTLGPAAAPAAPAQDGSEASDPALRQAMLERAAHLDRLAAQARADRAQYVAVLAHVAEGHAVLAARAGEVTQRATELRLRLADDRLQRVMTERPPPPAGVMARP